MEFYEPDTSSGIDSIPYKTKLTLQEICLVLRRRRLSPLMKICEQRKAGRRKQALLFFLLPMVPCAFVTSHSSVTLVSRSPPREKPSAWGGGKRDVARIKSISFDDVTTKQGPFLCIACFRRSDSRAQAKNLTHSPQSERLEKAILRSARAVLASKSCQILELYKL